MPELLITQEFIVLLASGIIVFGALLIGFWALFLRGGKEPDWKGKVKLRLRDLKHQELPPKYQVMEYDKLLEYTLQLKYGEDQSLGSLLKSKAKRFNTRQLNEIWSAHKLRNKIAHDHDFEPTSTEINRALIIFKRTVQELLQS